MNVRKAKIDPHGPLGCPECRDGFALTPIFDGSNIMSWKCYCGAQFAMPVRLTPEEWAASWPKQKEMVWP